MFIDYRDEHGVLEFRFVSNIGISNRCRDMSNVH